MIIYKATIKSTGKIYIGQTIRDFNVRKYEHLRSAQRLTLQKYPTPFHVDIRAYGSGDIEWETLEVCTSADHLNEREKFFIKQFDCEYPRGYNQTTGGSMDSTMSEITRRKIADSVSALHKNPEYKLKVYPKLKGLPAPNKGKPMSEAQKAKVSAAKKAVYADPSYTNPNLGAKRTDEQKANIKAGQQGKMEKGEAWHVTHKDQYTDEVRAKMSAAKLGKKPANTKKILCLETGEVFNGLTEASLSLGVNRQSIYMQIKGKLKAAGGKHFKYID